MITDKFIILKNNNFIPNKVHFTKNQPFFNHTRTINRNIKEKTPRLSVGTSLLMTVDSLKLIVNKTYRGLVHETIKDLYLVKATVTWTHKL